MVLYSMKTLHKFALALMMTTLPLGHDTARAQGSHADYQRALNLRERTQNKVAHAELRPFWIGDTAQFWYRSDELDGRHQFIRVDPTAKTPKAPAFDHQRLAQVLAAALGEKVDAERLPIERLEFSKGNTMRFLQNAQVWQLDLKTYDLKPIEADALGQIKARNVRDASRSTGNGAATVVTFINRSGKDAALFWVDSDGKRHDYGAIKAGDTLKRTTFSGHAWLIQLSGEDWATFLSEDVPGVAIIDGKMVDVEKREPRRDANLSPDGTQRVIFKDFNLALRDVNTKAETVLTTDGTAQNRYEGEPQWSPDGKFFTLMKVEPEQEHKVYFVESSPPDQVQPKLHENQYLKPGDRVRHERPQLFDVANKKQIAVKDDLFPNPWDIGWLEWEADSSRFTFLYNQRGHQVLRLIEVKTDGQTRALIDETSKTFIEYSGKTFLQRLDKTHEAIWMSERDNWNHLYLYDTLTGKVKNQITKGNWLVREVDRVDEDKRQIWFRTRGLHPDHNPYYVDYCRINFDGSGLTILTSGDGTHNVTFSPDNEYFVDQYSRVDAPPVWELHRSSDGKMLSELQRADASELLKTGWKYPEPFVAKGRDGTTDIYGVIIRPTNFDAAKSYPVVEDIYAGPGIAVVPLAFSDSVNTQDLAEVGFITVIIDGMGTTNRSKVFMDVCWKNLSDGGVPDREPWIKAAAQKYPYIDATRVGIKGTSAGGMNALSAILRHGDFYKAAVADCGCYDNRMDKIWWNEQWMGWPVDKSYEENSNVPLAKNLTGKLFLMVGEMDTNVDPASTMQVVDALIKADKDFDLLVVPGAGHGTQGSPYGKRRVWDFFVRSLMHVEPRRN